jgi:hypothetical protein
MTKAERLAAVFGIAFAVIYAPTMDFNWTLATYHPLQGIWQFGRAPPLGGGSPAMYWYGFVFTSALRGTGDHRDCGPHSRQRDGSGAVA